jgi:hypothetical protein
LAYSNHVQRFRRWLFAFFHNHRIHLQMPSELSQNRWQMIRQ